MAALIGGVLILLAGVSGLGLLAWTNYNRADRWQTRSERFERNVAALNEVLIDRSEQLNTRTQQLNQIAEKFARANRALSRSEADVTQLSRRQRELANEKAQIEDAQAKLQQAATAFSTCKDGLIDLLGYVVQGDYSSANFYVDQVDANCAYADETFNEYLSLYSG